jgi:CDP-paratose 2-epimerase
MTAKKFHWKYADQNQIGDHICCISSLAKFCSHYPNWSITIGLDGMRRQIIAGQTQHILSLETGK